MWRMDDKRRVLEFTEDLAARAIENLRDLSEYDLDQIQEYERFLANAEIIETCKNILQYVDLASRFLD